MRGHTVPRFHELTSQSGGKNPSVTPGSSIQSVIFDCKGLPTGDKGKFWYYCLGAVIKFAFHVIGNGSSATPINADQLWQVMASFNWVSPILGELFSHRNTRGSVLGNIIMPFARGMKAPPARAQISATTSQDTAIILTYKLPLAYSFLVKPHETAPWTGFLEGGQIECKVDLSTAIGAVDTGSVIGSTCNFRCHLQLIPSPEPVIHVPQNWREFVLPVNTTRHLLPDLGSPDGLQGIDTAKGIGIAAMLMLGKPTSNGVADGLGLAGAGNPDIITSYDLPFRTQARIDDVAGPVQWWLESLEKRPGQAGGLGTIVPADDGGWPYVMGSTPNGDYLAAADHGLMFYPFVVPSVPTDTSKVQTTRGPQEINVGYSATPSTGATRVVVHQLMQFTEQFAQGLQDLLLGYHDPAALRAPKTSNKNDPSTIHRLNPKLAYTRRKVYVPSKK